MLQECCKFPSCGIIDGCLTPILIQKCQRNKHDVQNCQLAVNILLVYKAAEI